MQIRNEMAATDFRFLHSSSIQQYHLPNIVYCNIISKCSCFAYRGQMSANEAGDRDKDAPELSRFKRTTPVESQLGEQCSLQSAEFLTCRDH